MLWGEHEKFISDLYGCFVSGVGEMTLESYFVLCDSDSNNAAEDERFKENGAIHGLSLAVEMGPRWLG